MGEVLTANNPKESIHVVIFAFKNRFFFLEIRVILPENTEHNK